MSEVYVIQHGIFGSKTGSVKKNHKYISRKKKNGKWVYTYPEDEKESKKNPEYERTQSYRNSFTKGRSDIYNKRSYKEEVYNAGGGYLGTGTKKSTKTSSETTYKLGKPSTKTTVNAPKQGQNSVTYDAEGSYPIKSSTKKVNTYSESVKKTGPADYDFNQKATASTTKKSGNYSVNKTKTASNTSVKTQYSFTNRLMSGSTKSIQIAKSMKIGKSTVTAVVTKNDGKLSRASVIIERNDSAAAARIMDQINKKIK